MGNGEEEPRLPLIGDAEALHDLNNLLGAIVSAASTLRRQLADGGQAAELASDIHAAAERATTLVRNRLMAARARRDGVLLVDVSAAVRDMERLLRCIVGQEVALTIDCAAFAGLAEVDRGRLENVVVNLVANARDATPRGGQITVSTAVTEPRGDRASYVAITVTDTGIGMDDDVRLRAFEPFFTTKPLGLGTGLGLPAAQRFVAECGGTIAVTSEIDRGTTVTLYLPRLD